MDNSTALSKGATKARSIIRDDIMGRLNPLMYDMVSDMHSRMRKEVPGMTGNTMTSPAGATYAAGVMDDIVLVGANGTANPPLQGKLKAGAKFTAGRERYDGDIQERTFTATVDTSGNTSQLDNYEFLESQQNGKGFKMTVIGGTEYLGMMQVADNFTFCQQEADKYFK